MSTKKNIVPPKRSSTHDEPFSSNRIDSNPGYLGNDDVSIGPLGELVHWKPPDTVVMPGGGIAWEDNKLQKWHRRNG